jgi:hypothetical protein
MFISFIVALLLLVQHLNNGDQSFLVGAIVFASVCAVFTILPVVFTFRMLFSLPQRRIRKLTHRVNSLPFERLVQKLQQEVDLLTSMITSLNAFTNSSVSFETRELISSIKHVFRVRKYAAFLDSSGHYG